MSDVAGRLLTFLFFLGAFAYVCFLFWGSLFEAEHKSRIAIRDSIRPGRHAISGTLSVPSPCHQVSLETIQLNAFTYGIQLNTWKEPSVRCYDEVTARSFYTEVRAPALGVQFVVFLNGIRQEVDYEPMLLDVQ